MSLDVYLTVTPQHLDELLIAADLLAERGMIEAETVLRDAANAAPVEVFSANVTHNVNRMADAAGIYEACWRPEEIGVTKAGQLVPLLRAGLERLRADPARFEAMNPSNGWGSYEGFVPWVKKYLEACEQHPDADVMVSR